MKRCFFIFFLFFFINRFASAQTGELIIKSSEKGLYLDHKVAAKENFYSIGRMYMIPPKEMAAFNKLDMSKGLSLGQTIRIPLTSSNFSQATDKGIPVYYKVGDKEGLLKISNANNNVSLENLRRWNNISDNNVSSGSSMIVGFLVAGVPGTVTIPENKEPVKVESQPVVIISEPKVEEKPVKTEPVIEKPKAEVKPVTPDQGYFKTSFDKQVRIAPLSKNATVTSGIFKTSSGWQDAKYYLLIDGVQPGTIIKVVNPDNNKTVYAKVLGEMSGIRQNEGFNIRISNAAATALQISEQEKFIVKVNY